MLEGKIDKIPESDKTSLSEYRKKLEKAGIIYYNDDGEMCTAPGVVPAETIQREIQQGVHHLD